VTMVGDKSTGKKGSKKDASVEKKAEKARK
jgi:hypothetical protein